MVKVAESAIIDAPVDAVWRILRDFNSHADWHPAVAESAIEGGAPADAVGAVRRFRLKDGGELREQLLAHSDEERSFSYCILEAPLPLMGYVATVYLKPVTDGDRTFWHWSSEFSPPQLRRDELTALVREGIYRAGFAALQARFGRPRQGVTGPSASSLPTSRGPVPVSARAHFEPTPPPARPAAAPVTVPLAFRGDRTRAIVVSRHGGPDVLEWREVEVPRPGPGEVTIRQSFVGVNFIDVYCRTGYFDLLDLPGVPGMEAAGEVEAVGPSVADLAPGDRVAYAGPPLGAYAERRTMPAALIVKLSDDISDETAAAGLLKGVTASFLLHDVHPVDAGKTILVHAAAGGVGQLLVQWASRLGATVVATASGDEKTALALRLGARFAIDYARTDFASEVKRLTSGRGVDVVYDAVGRDSFAGSLEALGVRGHLVSFGQASGPVGSWDIARFAAKSLTISRPNYAHYTDTPERLGPHVTRFFTALRRGLLSIAPPRRYPLSRAADAHRDLEARRTTGSLVLEV